MSDDDDDRTIRVQRSPGHPRDDDDDRTQRSANRRSAPVATIPPVALIVPSISTLAARTPVPPVTDATAQWQPPVVVVRTAPVPRAPQPLVDGAQVHRAERRAARRRAVAVLLVAVAVVAASAVLLIVLLTVR